MKEEANTILRENRTLLLTEEAAELLWKLGLDSLLRSSHERFYYSGYIFYHHVLLLVASSEGIARGWQEADKVAAQMGLSREQLKNMDE